MTTHQNAPMHPGAPTLRPATMLPPVDVAPSIGIGRLTKVELRKLVDTRSGLWLLIFTAAGTIGLGALWIWMLGETKEVTGWLTLMSSVGGPVAILLPVIAILAFTTEWSQRTALTTFVLEPRRTRVIVSKLLALAVLTLAGVVLMLAASAATAGLADILTEAPIDWSFQWVPLASALLTLTVSMAMGAGFGLLLMNSPAAIVAYLLLPTLTGVMSLMPGVVGTIGQWINGETWSLIFTPMTATQWGQAGVAFALWVVAPLALGTSRTLRTETK